MPDLLTVEAALSTGYRHIDTAAAYSNERSLLTISTLGRFSNHAETGWTERSAKTSMGFLLSRSPITVPERSPRFQLQSSSPTTRGEETVGSWVCLTNRKMVSELAFLA